MRKITFNFACLLLLNLSFNLSAQITVDGNPFDWANFQTNYPTNAYSQDANNTNDNQFTQGSKDGNALSTWAWTNGQTNNKGDISNAGALLTVESGHNMLAFCGDRAVNNGDAAIGFWFFKTEVGVVGTTAGTFSGTHANGDLLVVSHFTQGGGTATISIYTWQNGGLTGPISSSNAAVNSIVRPVPAGFTYASANYPIGDFFEGKIDLTNLGVAPCFTNFLLETRNSQSITASLQDFTFGSFTQTVSPPSTTDGTTCGSGAVMLSASGCTGGTLKWYDAETGGALVNTGSSYSLNITSTTTFYVSCTTADGCLSERTPVTATKLELPAAPSTMGAARCGNGSVTLSASGCSGGTLKWYSAATGGASINTGSTFTVNITSTITYYVSCTNAAGCVSARTAVIATLLPNPAAPLVAYIGPSCTETSFKVQVNNPVVGNTYTLKQLDGNTVTLPYANPLIFSNLHIGQGYSVISITVDGCKSNPNECGTFAPPAPLKSNPINLKVEQIKEKATVIASPNPYSDNIRFTVKSPISGQGALELYNMLGQQVKIIHQGNFEKDIEQTFEYEVPANQRANLIYHFRIGDEKTSGKLMSFK